MPHQQRNRGRLSGSVQERRAKDQNSNHCFRGLHSGRSNKPRASSTGRNQSMRSKRDGHRSKPVSLAQHLTTSTHQSFPASSETMESVVPQGNWRAWPELTVSLQDVPPGIVTRDLYRVFETYGGEIVYIEILESSGGRGLTARIRFDPIPSKACWEAGTILLPSKDGPQRVSIRLEPPRRRFESMVQSPVNPRISYSAVTRFLPASIGFGVMSDEKTMLVMKNIQSAISNNRDERVQLAVDLIRRKADVLFGMQINPGHIECYKFSLDFSILKRVYWHHVSDNSWALIIPTDFPPAYFWKRGDLEGTFSANRLSWGSRDLWCRITDILSDRNSVYGSPISLPNEPDDANFINLGRWTTFRFIIESEEKRDEVLRSLGDFNIKVELMKEFHEERFKGPSVWSFLDSPEKKTPIQYTNAASLLANLEDTPNFDLSFEVRYQLEVCISRGIFSEYRLGLDFLHKLRDFDDIAAKQLLEHVSDMGKAITDPMSIYNTESLRTSISIRSKPMVGNDRVLTRKVLVTPTTMYLTSPTPEIANRILRKYRNVQDRFLRVQFTGELLEGRINSRSDTDRDDEVYKRVFRVLDKGIRVGDRHFEFLAYGNSQIRENATYFFAPTEHISCDDIRKSMGSLGHIKSVAKYAARMGQCFSTTREVRTVNVPVISPIPDIENSQGYCFTDGVGKISKFLADMAANEMGLAYQVTPSLYQFRMGGCKGVLAVWPDAKNAEVHIRKSQEKFVSQYNGLEVIRCAQFATATLNRQTITILSCLGVPIEAFIALLDKHLEAHTKAELNSQDAITLLRQNVDENQTTLALANILLHRFKEPDVQEPFIMTVLNLWKIWSLKLIKEKARIPVEKSAFVLGCADETGTLRGHSNATEGSSSKDVSKLPQIFLQVSDPEEPQKSTVVTGVCIVGRNPSLHPGDIRVVEAVDVPALKHLRDVVVFPTKGDRDVPGMLSGGDLDGDDFFVIWDSTLLPPEWNHPPMEHLPVQPKILNRDVQTRDLQAFFVKYMKNDILPTVALAHLALADWFDDGAKNEKCLALAQLHSKAVDYVKSGEPAEMDKSLRPRRWPTFMEKRVPKEATYRSQKALGIIYDKVHSVTFTPTYTNSFDKRILDKCVNDNEILKKARQIKTQYDTALRRVMGQREIATEFELWSGFILSRPRNGSWYKLQEEIGREYGSIKMAFREMCQEAAGGATAPRIDAFVAAMYKVTEEEVNIELHMRRGALNFGGKIVEPKATDAKSMPLISFPWIFHEVLCRLATGTKGTEAFQEMKSEGKTPVNRGRSMNSGEGDMETHLNDGRIVHRGEVLNLFEPTEEEDELANSAPSAAATPAISDVPAGNYFNLDIRSGVESGLSKSFSAWVSKIQQRESGKPDAWTSMMSQIERDLADMSLGKQIKPIAEEHSVVSALEMQEAAGASQSKPSPGVLGARNAMGTVSGVAQAPGDDDLLCFSLQSNEASPAKKKEYDFASQEEAVEERVGHIKDGSAISAPEKPKEGTSTELDVKALDVKHANGGSTAPNEDYTEVLTSKEPNKVAGSKIMGNTSAGNQKTTTELWGNFASNGAANTKALVGLHAPDLPGKREHGPHDMVPEMGQVKVIEVEESSALDRLLAL